jgi:hypothetical protein
MWTNTFLFLPYMAIGWWLVTSEVERGGGDDESHPSFHCKFGDHSKSLCFWFFLWEFVLKLVHPASGEDCSLDPLWSYADARVRKGIKLVWFGYFKIQFGSCILANWAACLTSLLWYINDPMWRLENRERLSASHYSGCEPLVLDLVLYLNWCGTEGSILHKSDLAS